MLITTVVTGLWITPVGSKHAIPQEKIMVHAGQGILGDKHYGFQRISDVRDKGLYKIPKGILVFNWRQFAITSSMIMLKLLKL
jgi:hypothetical protein